MKIPKQTKLWKTKSNEKIRICDMDNNYLLNSIKYIERQTKEFYHKTLSSAYSILNFVTGEMVMEDIENNISILEEEIMIILI